jgi:flagellar biosynthesis component FlhA
MVEDIRLALHPRLPGRPDTWRWFKVSPRFEKALLAGVRGCADDPHFALAAEETQKLVAGLRAQISSTDRAALVVNDSTTRALLSRLVEFDFPHCAVLSEEEIIHELPPVSGVVDFEPEP